MPSVIIRVGDGAEPGLSSSHKAGGGVLLDAKEDDAKEDIVRERSLGKLAVSAIHQHHARSS